MENILDALAIYGYSNLEDRIEFELDGVIEKEIAPAYCNENFELCVSCMDYTSLKVTDTEKSIMTFVSELLKKLKAAEKSQSVLLMKLRKKQYLKRKQRQHLTLFRVMKLHRLKIRVLFLKLMMSLKLMKSHSLSKIIFM